MIKFLLLIISTFVWSVRLDCVSTKEKIGEYGNYFEGDMILNQEQIKSLCSTERNGLIDSNYRWPNKTVTYLLNSNGHSQQQQDYIETALKVIESASCLKFVPRRNEEDYIHITNEEGCFAQVGYQGGPQMLNLANSELGTGCFHMGTILHELLHALGFYHMHNANDRDEYVTVYWKNIWPGKEYNFKKYTNKGVTHLNHAYDFASIMHFSPYAYSKNGKPTIVPVDTKHLEIMGNRMKLSATDIVKLNEMYECD